MSNRQGHYYLNQHPAILHLGSITLLNHEDVDDAFSRFFCKTRLQQLALPICKYVFDLHSIKDPSFLEEVMNINFLEMNTENFKRFRASLLLCLADIGIQINGNERNDAPETLLSRLNNEEIYIGREKTLKICGLVFTPTA